MSKVTQIGTSVEAMGKKVVTSFAGMSILALLLTVLALSLSTLAYAATAAPITGVAGKCVDVKGGRVSNRTKVQLYTCNSTSAQLWEQSGDGTLRSQNHCLDIQWGHLAVKTPVWLYDCNGSASQQWKVNSDGLLVNPKSGLCLDDMHGSTKNGNELWVYTCNTSAAQKWTATIPQVVATPPAPTQQAAPSPQPSSSTGGGYTNVDGNHVNSPSANPAGATARCKDGTYSDSQHHSGTCSGHGGVESWL